MASCLLPLGFCQLFPNRLPFHSRRWYSTVAAQLTFIIALMLSDSIWGLSNSIGSPRTCAHSIFFWLLICTRSAKKKAWPRLLRCDLALWIYSNLPFPLLIVVGVLNPSEYLKIDKKTAFPVYNFLLLMAPCLLMIYIKTCQTLYLFKWMAPRCLCVFLPTKTPKQEELKNIMKINCLF